VHVDSVAADLALLASAQKVEHYEISAYGTARAMAGQIGLPAVGALLVSPSRKKRSLTTCSPKWLEN
jgi:ferritin-like metal-binding protein YciE